MDNTTCPRCGGLTKGIPAGTSKTSGKAYSAFYVCAGDCKDSAFSSDAQWAFKHGDYPDDGPSVKVLSGASLVITKDADAIVVKPKVTPKPKPAAKAKAPSDAVRKVIFANKIIEALRDLTPEVRESYLDEAGFNMGTERSYVMFVNKMDLAALGAIADSMGIVE